MKDSPTYTIAVSSCNMENTVQRSLESMLEQVTDEYEVVVVDDSTDDSPDILQEMENNWDSLRVFTDCGNDNLAEARNESFERARGDYVLSSLDVDNIYEPVIQDFVTIYHQMEQAVDTPLFLSGQGINMAPRSLLLDIPYRSLGYGEDRDYWRQMMAAGVYVGIEHPSIEEQIGYQRGAVGTFEVGFETIMVQFQSGMKLRPYIRWAIAETVADRGRPRHRALLHVMLSVPAYVAAMMGEQTYKAPEPYDDMSVWKHALRSHTMTLSELEAAYGFSIDRSNLSDAGREVFDVDNANFPL